LAVAVLPFAVGSCEDGPNQTYSPAPPNAGSIWNGSPGQGGLGDGGAFVPPATQGYDASVGGTNANDLCTPITEKAVWGTLFQEPIAPPGLAGGIDMAGGPKGDGASGYGGGCSSSNVAACTGAPPAYTYDPTKETWSGATVEQVEAFLCQGVASQTFQGYTDQVGWGENTEVNATYNTSNREIFWLNLTYGYAGTLGGTICDSTKGMCTGVGGTPIAGSGDSYSMSMENVPATYTPKGGMPQQVLLDWSNKTALYQYVNGFYESLRYTYDPSYPAAAGATSTTPGSCVNSGDCQVFDDGASGGGFYFTPLGILIYYQTTVGTPQANSIPIIIQLVLQKLLPFSLSTNMAKLDVEGPTAITTNIYGTGGTCKYVLGQDFGTFNKTCVDVYPSSTPNAAALNAAETAKLFGAMAHGDEQYEFNIQGVDPQFVASSLPPTSVIADGQTPQDSDLSYQLAWDQQLLGKIDNDYTANDPTQPQDLHGFGMIMLEWANTVQHYMQQAYHVNTELGEPACLTTTFNGVTYTNTTSNPGPSIVGQPVAGMPTSPVKCSGLEGITTPAPSNFVQFPQQKVNAIGTGATQAGPGATPAGSLMAPGMHPGTWYSLFCNDAGGLSLGVPNGYQDCIGGSAGFQNQASYYLDTMQDAVLQTGNFGTVLAQMPQRDLGNRRFFFQQWMLAFTKYLQVAAIADGTSATNNLAFVDSQTVDPNELFFDTSGQAGTGFENAEYVFRNNVNSAMQAPTDFQVTAELLQGSFDLFVWGRYNFRGEKALYTALTTTPGDLPGAENLYLSNVASSPLLQTTYTSYACAINTDVTNANCGATASTPAILGPLDALGNPVLTGYQGAFGQSIFAVGKPSAFTIDTSGASMGKDFPLIESAYLTIPIWANPYDPTSATPQDKTISALLPYLPAGAYPAGFPVTIDGSRDKWYNTDQITYSGETVDGTLDFENVPTALADGGVQNQWVVRAIESQNYLGLGFFCSQTNPSTGQPDLLYVRMYDLAANLLGYIEKYPAATTTCDIQIKYSIYGNYADYISSLTNGVRFGLNPGFGGAVVADLTIFDPSIVPTLGQ
jgi:hypothetical protein